MNETVQAIIDNCDLFTNSIGSFMKTENHTEADMLKLLRVHQCCKILKLVAKEAGDIYNTLGRK